MRKKVIWKQSDIEISKRGEMVNREKGYMQDVVSFNRGYVECLKIRTVLMSQILNLL